MLNRFCGQYGYGWRIRCRLPDQLSRCTLHCSPFLCILRCGIITILVAFALAIIIFVQPTIRNLTEPRNHPSLQLIQRLRTYHHGCHVLRPILTLMKREEGSSHKLSHVIFVVFPIVDLFENIFQGMFVCCLSTSLRFIIAIAITGIFRRGGGKSELVPSGKFREVMFIICETLQHLPSPPPIAYQVFTIFAIHCLDLPLGTTFREQR
mmetsp:Transcript_18585/g.40227  ORF Transcript_18585/g.40227 Transcript_18585/m.40227 type:complete len:208 (+) Transcript_18585:4523-5146(+)